MNAVPPRIEIQHSVEVHVAVVEEGDLNLDPLPLSLLLCTSIESRTLCAFTTCFKFMSKRKRENYPHFNSASSQKGSRSTVIKVAVIT